MHSVKWQFFKTTRVTGHYTFLTNTFKILNNTIIKIWLDSSSIHVPVSVHTQKKSIQSRFIYPNLQGLYSYLCMLRESKMITLLKTYLNFHTVSGHFSSRVPQRNLQALVCSTSSTKVLLDHATPHGYVSRCHTLPLEVLITESESNKVK